MSFYACFQKKLKMKIAVTHNETKDTFMIKVKLTNEILKYIT